jgi:hypothetical protein
MIRNIAPNTYAFSYSYAPNMSELTIKTTTKTPQHIFKKYIL